MSNILLIDTNFSSVPIYNCLVRLGHSVYVVGSNPKDCLAKCVALYEKIDYSNLNKVQELIKKRDIKYIVPGCNDRSYMICAALNHDGRYPGIDTTQTTATINNKEKFRRFAQKHCLPVPALLSPEEIGTQWPVIVKPVDAYSGRGITIIQESDRDHLSIAAARAIEFSSSKTYIIEDYVQGQLYSHSAFIQRGQVLIDYIVEEHCTANPFVVDTSRVRYDFSQQMLMKLRENVRTMAKELNLQDGLVHTQLIVKGKDYWLIEVTRRCPGDLYSQLIELSTGTNYAENYVRSFIDMPLAILSSNESKLIMRHTISQPIDCILGFIKFHTPLQIERLVPISSAGDKVCASPAGRIAVLFAKADSVNEFNNLFNATLERKIYHVSPDEYARDNYAHYTIS